METSTKVTRINNRWHCRLFVGDKLIDEMACEYRTDVGYCCRTMMRWYDKACGGNEHSRAVRDRMWNKEKYPNGPEGRVWYYPELIAERNRRGLKSQ